MTYLRERLGEEKRIRVEVGSNYLEADVAEIPFTAFAAYLESEADADGSVAYWAQDTFPSELERDIISPSDDVGTTNLDKKMWCGPSTTLSPLHFDPTHNLFVQVVGSKDIALAPTDESGEELMRVRQTNQSHNTSSMDAFDPNEAFDVYTLRPGDAAVIPKKMWHSVRAVNETPYSMSVSFWWTTRQ